MDKHPSYIPFAKSKPGIKYKTIKVTDHANNQHKQLRKDLGKFNGVSSKYLQNYFKWLAYGKNIELFAN